VRDDTKKVEQLVLEIKVISLGTGWVYKRPIPRKVYTTDRSSSKRSKRDPRAKRVWVG